MSKAYKHIDINADLGEGYDLYSDAEPKGIMPYITSANIACGFHAGSYTLMDQTVQMAIKHKVKVGAHPGYPDPAGFGRKAIDYSIEALRGQFLYQIGALKAITEYRGTKLNHVKPHGAFYHLASSDSMVAKMIAETMASIDPTMALVGMYDSECRLAAEHFGIPFLSEVFADRRYDVSGQLVDRQEQGAIISKPVEGIEQIKDMLRDEKVVDTICVHGDNVESLAFAKAVYTLIKE